MAEYPVVEIVSPKNPKERLVINVDNFDPAIHTLWENREQAPSAPPQDDRATSRRTRTRE